MKTKYELETVNWTKKAHDSSKCPCERNGLHYISLAALIPIKIIIVITMMMMMTWYIFSSEGYYFEPKQAFDFNESGRKFEGA